MAKKTALVFGIVFLLIGVLGFIPNPIAGYDAFFHTDLAHNLVHLISGAVLLYVSLKMSEKAVITLKVFGVVYLLVAVIGFFTVSDSILGIIGANDADDWLHLVLGVVMLGIGIASARGADASNLDQMSGGDPMGMGGDMGGGSSM